MSTSSETQVGQVLVWEPVSKPELDHDVLTSQCTLQKVSCSITAEKDGKVRRLGIKAYRSGWLQTLSHHLGSVATHASTDALTIPVHALAPRITLDRYQVLRAVEELSWATPGRYIRKNMIGPIAENVGHKLNDGMKGELPVFEANCEGEGGPALVCGSSLRLLEDSADQYTDDDDSVNA